MNPTDKTNASAERISNFDDKNLSTYFDSQEKPSFLKTVISDEEFLGRPDKCPFNDHSYHFLAPQAKVVSTTTYGGPGSKYKKINEDSYFFGMNTRHSLISGVIDGSGGSKSGYLGGKMANEALSLTLRNGDTLRSAFSEADRNVIQYAKGGYAAGVAVEVQGDLKTFLASKGDAKALTLRDGEILKDGTSIIHSKVAYQIDKGQLPAHAIHTSNRKNVIYSVIGNRRLPLHQSSFQGESGDMIIMATDGLWDVVTDYEILQLSAYCNAKDLQKAIYDLALERNNSRKPFSIQFSEKETHVISPLFFEGEVAKGDNITVQIIELSSTL